MSLFLMCKPLYDVVIVGAGIAGLTAGIYASSLGAKTLILEGSYPSRLLLAKVIYNYPGFPEGISGRELLERVRAQALKMGSEIRRGDVVSMILKTTIKSLMTRKETITAKAVIIATGIRRERLNIPGEERFLGLGVSYCAICDGPLYRNRRVAVIGYGDDAITDTIFLSSIAREVYFIPLKPLPKVHVDKLSAYGNVRLLLKVKVKSIIGRDRVEEVELVRDGEVEKVSVDGVFIITEETPTPDVIKNAGIRVDERGCIKVNQRQETNIEGVYTAGDCTCGGMQAITAAGQGALAAINAVAYIRSKRQL